MTISCDFDGTVTVNDSVQALLNAFGDPRWLEIEADWVAGRIGSRACLQRQTALLRVSEPDLDAWTDALEVDPAAAAFFAACQARALGVRVVSDGYDRLIHRVMRRLGLGHIAVAANRLLPLDDGGWRVEFPHARIGCEAGTCKCRATARPRVHVGDGRSDECVADASETVFAKAGLLASRRARRRPAIACANLDEARRLLVQLDTSED